MEAFTRYYTPQDPAVKFAAQQAAMYDLDAIPPERTMGTLTQATSGDNGARASLTMVSEALRLMFDDPNGITQAKIDQNIMREGRNKYAAVINGRPMLHQGDAIDMAHLRASNVYNGELDIADDSQNADIGPNAKQSYTDLLTARIPAEVGKTNGFIMEKGEQVFALSVHKVDATHTRVQIFVPSGLRGGPAFMQTFDTVEKAAQFLAAIAPHQPTGNNRWLMTGVSKALPECPLSGDPVPPADQIVLYAGTDNEQVFDIRNFTKAFITSYWYRVPDGTVPGGQRWMLGFRDPMTNLPIDEAELKRILPRIANYFGLTYLQLINIFMPQRALGEAQPMFDNVVGGLQLAPPVDANRLFVLLPQHHNHQIPHAELDAARGAIGTRPANEQLDFLAKMLSHAYIYDYVTHMDGNLEIAPRVKARFLQQLQAGNHPQHGYMSA